MAIMIYYRKSNALTTRCKDLIIKKTIQCCGIQQQPKIRTLFTEDDDDDDL